VWGAAGTCRRRWGLRRRGVAWPGDVAAKSKATRALLVSKRPGNYSTLVNQKKKKRKNLALPARTQWYASPWAPLSSRVLEGEGKSEEGRGKGR